MNSILDFDTRLFLWINGHHCTAMDWTMWVLSQHWCWAIVLLLVFAGFTLRREPRRWWVAVAGVALCFLLADQGSVHLFKDTVCRLRPCHVIEDVQMFRTHCGGQYGFVSSHAANIFAIVAFLWLRYGKRREAGKGDIAGLIVLTLWAVAVGYSRVYLGKHYPGDVLCGALFGFVVGLIVWLFVRWIEKKFTKCETK